MFDSYEVKKGAIQKNTTLDDNDSQYVYGTAINTTVGAYCSQIISGGSALDTKVLKYGEVYVLKGGIAKNISVEESGKININGGTIDTATFSTAVISCGKSNGNKNYITGSNYFNNLMTWESQPKESITAKKGAIISIQNCSIGELSANIKNASLNIIGHNYMKSISIDKNTKISYDLTSTGSIEKMQKITGYPGYSFDLKSKNTQKCGKFSITVRKNQSLGSYDLSKNIVQKSKTAYTLNIGSSSPIKIGTLKLNGQALEKNGVSYSIKSFGKKYEYATSLFIGIKAGKILKGKAKDDKLVGSTHSDIFYGGKGNDTITGKNGRDVAVYDKTAWGKDKIVKTDGMMTILFKDLKENDVVKKIKGTTMTITRKSDKSQSVTVQDWNIGTHSVVFGGTMKSFNKWLKASQPTAKITSTAQKEVWKKTVLAQ